MAKDMKDIQCNYQNAHALILEYFVCVLFRKNSFNIFQYTMDVIDILFHPSWFNVILEGGGLYESTCIWEDWPSLD